MGSPYGGTSILSAMGIILPYAIWGFFVGIVFLHASSHNRSTWLWTLVAFIPFFGILIYFAYYYYKTDTRHGYLRRRKLERMGEYIAKPRTRREKEEYEQVAILANYRDKEIEELLLDGKAEDAIAKIEERAEEALEKGDKTAKEAYGLYLQSAVKYKHTLSLPRVLLQLWDKNDQPEEPPEDIEPEKAEPLAIGDGRQGEDAEEAEEDIYYDPDDDRNRWLEL